jgi:hypothetical protein
MTGPDPTTDPDDYVMANKQQLVQIIKHSSDTFVRALALAALVEYGDELSVGEVLAEIRRMQDIDEEK